MAANAQLEAFQRQLAALDASLTQLSTQDTSLDVFFREFLDQIVRVLGVGGGVWLVGGEQEVAQLCHMNLNVAGMEPDGRQLGLLRQALGKVIQTQSPVVLPGNDQSNVFDGGLGREVSNQSPHTLLFVPIIGHDKVDAVFLLVGPAGVDPRAVRGYLGFLQGMCAKAGSFLQRQRISGLAGQLARSERMGDYVAALNSTLDPRRACYALANYAQELLGVYRCIAGTFSASGRFRIEAVSGLEAVAVKSTMIQNITAVCRQVCRNRKPLTVDNPNAVKNIAEAEGEDLLTMARIYMLEAGSLVMGIFPIMHEDNVVGALIVEKAGEGLIDEGLRRRIDAMIKPAGPALNNSMNYRRLPLAPLMRSAGAVRDRVLRMDSARRVVWAAIVVLVCATPFIITRPVKVMGTAELVPVQARKVYAMQEGVIKELQVTENQVVEAGDVLAVLDRRQVESELDRVTAEIAEADLSLKDAQSKRPGSSEVRRLEARLQALNAERKKYELDMQQHEIIAPVTGKVITPEHTLRLLENKPVDRGEAVMEIVPTKTAWELSVTVPEDEAGNLLLAYKKLEEGESLKGRVLLNAYPDLKLQSRVIAVAPRAQVLKTDDQSWRNVIEVRMAEPAGLDDPDAFRAQVDLRPGLQGKAAIECGRRSLFYAMTHEFVDFVRISIF
ncbi:MAG: HlyD family efflux transporter periplasmic adaptor subunit [Sedimentisphaerales bacterium]|nr:HlyD family efflux transporter periplasmic adaptor subunit [Sedimentisphaerales bacterium]